MILSESHCAHKAFNSILLSETSFHSRRVPFSFALSMGPISLSSSCSFLRISLFQSSEISAVNPVDGDRILQLLNIFGSYSLRALLLTVSFGVPLFAVFITSDTSTVFFIALLFILSPWRIQFSQ